MTRSSPTSAQALSYTVTGKPGATATPITLAGGTASGAPSTGAHVKGELVLDDTGAAWYCTVAGTPGTWAKGTNRKLSIVSSATPAINTDLYDKFDITAQATAITSMTTNLSGAPLDMQSLLGRIKDDGTARAIAWGAGYANRGGVLPLTTIVGKITYVMLIYNLAAVVWDCVGTSQEP